MAPAAAHAQSNDAEVWTTATLDVDLPNELRLGTSHSLRFDEDVSGLKSSFQDIHGRYAVNDFIRVHAGYRYYFDRAGETAHRIFGGLGLRYRPENSPWRFRYRARVQTTTRDMNDDLTYLRNRVGVDYKVRKRLWGFGSGELYYRFRDGASDEFRRYRIRGGMDWRVAKRTEVTGFAMVQREFNVGAPEQDFVVGIELTYRYDAR